jgi:hypothetical protein
MVELCHSQSFFFQLLAVGLGFDGFFNLFDYTEAVIESLIRCQIDITHAAAVYQFLNLISSLQDFAGGYDCSGYGKDKATGATDLIAYLIWVAAIRTKLFGHKLP